jgi:hypothetical protein
MAQIINRKKFFMRILQSVIFLIVLMIIFFVYCNDASSPDTGSLTIDYASIQAGDSLNPGAGIIIRFSGPVDLNSFNPQEIQTSYDIIYSDSTGPQTYTIGQQVYKIVSSGSVLVNGQPVTLWYNPATLEVALFEETTLQMPFGTGEGLVIDRDSMQVVFRGGIAGECGCTLGSDYELIFYRTTNTYRLRTVPNPAYPSFTSQGLQYPRVNFNDLPPSCVINIYDLTNTLVKSLQHSGGGMEQWDLIDTNGSPIAPGIFRFEIFNSTGIIPGGIFVFPAFE